MRLHRARGAAVPLLLVLTASASACTDAADSPPGALGGPGRDSDPVPATSAAGMAPVPQAISLLGEELHTLPADPASAAANQARLDSAEARYAARPDDADALVWLGRRLAYTGRYRDAIRAFSQGIERHPDDARFYRHRGHRWITVRELDRAVEDLAHATRLTSGEPDVVEPDGLPNAAGVPVSTLQTNIWYHLGLAHYLMGDYEEAVHAFRTGFRISANDDMRVAMADWLWMALRRLDRPGEADRAIAFARPDMEILENDAYHRRLLLYRGLISPDSVAPALLGDDSGTPPTSDERSLQLATYGYGLGNWYLVQGDRTRAHQTFQDVLGTGYWPAFGYIAAEADLARWDALTASTSDRPAGERTEPD